MPELRARLGNLDELGVRSTAFPAARKSQRQIIRILGNPQYDHLVALIQTIELCLRAGYDDTTLLRTRGASQFTSAVSELQVADHLRRHGFSLTRATSRADRPIPELVAKKGERILAVEVYAPRQWEGLDLLTETLHQELDNLDLPLDFEYELSLGRNRRFNSSGQPLDSSPAEVAIGLDRPRRGRLIEELFYPLTASLRGDAVESRNEVVLEDLNLLVSAEVRRPCASLHYLPDRSGTTHCLPVNGYSPEGMFARILNRVHAKSLRGQAAASSSDGLAVLVVDLTHAELTSELWSGYYKNEFEQTLRERLAAPAGGYDLVCFSSWTAAGSSIQTHFVLSSGAPAQRVARDFFAA